jgi:hypothetical protein
MINSIDDEIVTKDEKEFLHLLRKERNNLVHPNRKRTNLSVENLTNILDIVFKEEMVQ